MSNPSYLRKGNDESVVQLITEMNDGKMTLLLHIIQIQFIH